MRELSYYDASSDRQRRAGVRVSDQKTVDVLVRHVHSSCVTSRDRISEPRIGGLVFCECGSAGWVES